MTCPECKTIFVFAIPFMVSGCVEKPTCPACGTSSTFEACEATHIDADSTAVAEALGIALRAQQGELARKNSGAPPRSNKARVRHGTFEWEVHEGKPCLFLPEEIEPGAFAIRIPDVETFQAFMISLMTAGAAAFPEIAADLAMAGRIKPEDLS